MILAAAFDLEGTCIDLEPLHFLAYEKACRDFGINLDAREIAAIPGAVGGGRKFIVEALIAANPAKNINGLEESKKKHFSGLLEQFDFAPRSGLLELLNSLVARGIPLAIGSTTARKEGEGYLIRSGLSSFFPFEKCVFREDVVALKPDGEVYKKTAALLSVTPEEQVVFEDSVIGVLAACAAGSRTYAVPSPFHISESVKKNLLSGGAEAVFDSWESVDISTIEKAL